MNVQAIAACLFIVGLKDESRQVVSKFTWGEGFHTLNLELLEAYSACSDSASVVACQQAYFDAWAAEREERKRSAAGVFLWVLSTLYFPCCGSIHILRVWQPKCKSFIAHAVLPRSTPVFAVYFICKLFLQHLSMLW
jgi:hypothetical protein